MSWTSIGWSHSLHTTTACMSWSQVVWCSTRGVPSGPVSQRSPHAAIAARIGICVSALVGEAILVTDRVLLVLDATQHTLFDEPGEALREHVAPDPEFVLELLEAAGAEAGLADQQQVPVVAEHRSTPGDGAWPIGGVDTLHTASLRRWVASWNVQRLRCIS